MGIHWNSRYFCYFAPKHISGYSLELQRQFQWVPTRYVLVQKLSLPAKIILNYHQQKLSLILATVISLSGTMLSLLSPYQIWFKHCMTKIRCLMAGLGYCIWRFDNYSVCKLKHFLVFMQTIGAFIKPLCKYLHFSPYHLIIIRHSSR